MDEETAETPESPSETEAEPDNKPDGESNSPEAIEAAKDEDDEPEEWRNLVKKYESVEDEKERKAAIGKEYWEKTRYVSQVQKERDELKARLTELESNSKPEKVEEEEEVSPDLQAIESREKALEAKQAAFPKVEHQLLVELGKQDDEIAVLEYRLNTALEEEKPTVKAELRAAKAERSHILATYRNLETEKSAIKEKLEDLADRKRSASSRLEIERARQKQAESDRQKFQADFPREIDNYIVRSMDELKVPPDKGLRQDLWETVNESLMVEYWKMGGKDPAAIDHSALVRKHVERYAKRMDIIGRAKFKQFSEKKADVAARLSPTINRTPPPQKETVKPLLPYEVNQRDERLEKARKTFLGR